ncbi:hypothetical protein [Niabella hirudinis]|uniref:hypothetical protein n=1 Tax=Niabella hirudinis TaxID=1285929 RepID=UPI003EBC281D
MRSTFFTVVAVFCFFELFSQSVPTYQKLMSLGGGGGYNFSLKNYITRNPMDGLLGYRDHYGAINPSIYVFPAKRWGLMIAFNIDPVSVNEQQVNVLNQSLEAYYSDFEFERPAYGHNWDFVDDPGSFRALAGPVYRFENKRWFFWGSLGLGVTSFNTAGLHAAARKQQTNTYYSITKKGKSSPAPFTVSPGMLAGYRISRRIAVTISTRAAYFKTDFSQTVFRTNRYTGVTEEDLALHFDRSSLNLGADASFFIMIPFPKK